MKKITLTSLLSAFALAANAAPLVSIGDQTDIFFRGAVLGNYNSNVTYANTNKIDDYAGTLRLGLDAQYGKTSKFKASFSYYEDFTKYVDNHEFNCNLAHIAANASYTESRWNVSAYFTFDQNRQNDADTWQANQQGWLVRYNSWTAGVKGQYDFSEKIYGTGAFGWTAVEYTGNWDQLYYSHDTYSVPLSLLYRATEKIAVGLSYQYRYTEYDRLGANYGRDDNFIGVTVNGEIAPKMTCEWYVGAQNYKIDGEKSTWTFATNLTLGYEVSEKCGVYVKASRDFGSSAGGYTTTYTFGEGGVNYYFNPKVVGTASLRYTETEYSNYQNRTDETIWTRVGVSYIPNKFVTLGVNYNYINNSSDIDYANYNQHLISFNVSLRY